MSQQLAPVPQPVGVFPHFIAQQSLTLVMKEKVMSLSGDSFDVTLENGQPLIKVEGKLFSVLAQRKTVRDMQGNHLFDIEKEVMHVHTTFALKDPNGNKFMEVKSSIKLPLTGSKTTATFTNPQTGQPQTLLMRGRFMDTTCEIVHQESGAVAALIKRKVFNMREVFGQQTYHVTVAPGVDMALIAALCICMDEKRESGGSSIF